jgi:hypothetical protein
MLPTHTRLSAGCARCIPACPVSPHQSPERRERAGECPVSGAGQGVGA